MTACNIWLQPNAGHMIADAAMYEDDGRVAWIGSKMVYSAGSKIALMALGRASHRHIADFLAKARPTNTLETLQCLVPMAHDIREMLKRDNPGCEADGTNEFILACLYWHDALNRPEAAIIDTGSRQALAEPYILQPIVGLSTPEGRDPLPHDLGSGLLNADEHGVAVMESQRAKLDPGYSPEDISASIVGGRVEAITITADGVNHRVLHTWPDVVGERIAP